MSFINEAAVKAVRKQHQCCGCSKVIQVGEPAVRWTGITDGDFSSVVYHPDCRRAELALNELHGTFCDEWMGLWDLDWEDFRWLLEEFPAVAARKGITLALVEENEAEQQRMSAHWRAA